MYWQPALVIGGTTISNAREMHDVINPATEDGFATAPRATAADVSDALEAARGGLRAWRAETPWRRSEVLRSVSRLLRERIEDIAETMTREVGKPLAEARTEIVSAIEHFDWCADETRRLYDQSIGGRVPQARLEIRHEPIGIVLALTAWNFPIGLAARKLAMALAAGCSVILRPADEAPGTATALVACCVDAGLPAGAINLLHGDVDTIVAPLMAQPDIRKVSFTGSTRVGQILVRQSADTLKKLTMELGGHAPFIVLGDVDVSKAAAAAVAGKFRNAGQVCTSPTRFLVDTRIAEEFTDLFSKGTRALKIGNGLDEGVLVGPLTTARQRTRIEAMVADARDHGAEIVAGGARPAGFNRGYFLEPTVVFNPSRDASILNEEPFGPVAVIQPVDGVEQAIAEANRLEYGLASYLYTGSQSAIDEISSRLQTGVLGINTNVVALPEGPFGGVKQSGFGREGGAEGVREYLQTKFVHRHPAL
jgi:succinate-semialdehyde dehydrogenase/glutarate-semialdehyde dehydrogenase